MVASKYLIFAKAIELRSFTRAAEALGCTQSAVSHAINTLETETRLKLVIRSRSGIRLTADGERLMPAILAIVNAMDQFDDTLQAIHGFEIGRVRIGAFTSVAVHWLPNMIKQYQQAHPNIEFGLSNGDYHDIAEWFANDSIDIGFVTLPSNISGCTFTPLMEDRLLAVLPRNHRLVEYERIPPAAFVGEPFISLLETSDRDARSVLEQAGITPNIKFTTKDDYAIIAMVEQGLGISIMPELLLKGHTDKICVKEIEGAKKRTIGLAVSTASSMSPSVQSFAEHIRSWVKAQQDAQGNG